jgi:hypothetical protein
VASRPDGANLPAGIGTCLMAAAEDWARGRGAGAALLGTSLHGPTSVPFYEHGTGYARRSIRFRKALA